MVTQSYRTNSSTINLENLFSNLMDKSRRQVSKDQEIVLVISRRPRPNQANWIYKNKYCKKCKTTTHSIKDCFYLFPEKALKGFKTKHYYELNQEALVSINTSDPSDPSNEEDDFEIDLDLMDTEQVLIIN